LTGRRRGRKGTGIEVEIEGDVDICTVERRETTGSSEIPTGHNKQL
jgi:hypothetical protein